jgi:hypothetical protein
MSIRSVLRCSPVTRAGESPSAGLPPGLGRSALQVIRLMQWKKPRSRPWRRLLFGRMLLAAPIVTAGLFTQDATVFGATPLDAGVTQSSSQAIDAALTHSVERATTFVIVAVLADLAILPAGAGSVVGSALLAAFNTSKSWLLYTANDYAWNTYLSSEGNKDGSRGFDAEYSI